MSQIVGLLGVGQSGTFGKTSDDASGAAKLHQERQTEDWNYFTCENEKEEKRKKNAGLMKHPGHQGCTVGGKMWR